MKHLMNLFANATPEQREELGSKLHIINQVALAETAYPDAPKASLEDRSKATEYLQVFLAALQADINAEKRKVLRSEVANALVELVTQSKDLVEWIREEYHPTMPSRDSVRFLDTTELVRNVRRKMNVLIDTVVEAHGGTVSEACLQELRTHFQKLEEYQTFKLRDITATAMEGYLYHYTLVLKVKDKDGHETGMLVNRMRKAS